MMLQTTLDKIKFSNKQTNKYHGKNTEGKQNAGKQKQVLPSPLLGSLPGDCEAGKSSEWTCYLAWGFLIFPIGICLGWLCPVTNSFCSPLGLL